ncbi:hypothetical protein ANN_09184 [Periplaneta americana]|uniref:Endonuclease-reverse transcriptase n=1 Tax=Periplaneta americana TaxID=6978 RepID=A0ABQ8TMW1_PERAM|nr:hypothetical protein ANN_09184 [Periplaneta americana]
MRLSRCKNRYLAKDITASLNRARHNKKQQQPITDSQEAEKPTIASLTFTGKLSGKVSGLLYKHGIKAIHKPPPKIRNKVRSVKDDQGLRVPGIYRILCECEAAYIGQTGRTITTRLSEHQRSIRLSQLLGGLQCNSTNRRSLSHTSRYKAAFKGTVRNPVCLRCSKTVHTLGYNMFHRKLKTVLNPLTSIRGSYNIVRNGNINIGNLSFEEVEKFKYLGATVTNINDTREEIKHRINMGNACYYSVEKLLSSSLLSKNLKVRIYKTVILPVLLYGCETWTLTLREEHRLRVFENKVLRKIFGAKRDEVTGEWRKLHNTELHALYSSPDIIRNLKSRRLRWAGHVARMGESRNAYRVLVGRPEGKRPLGRPRRRWEDNIKMDLREVGYDDRDWLNLAQDRDRWRVYVRAAMNLRVP